MIDAEQELKAAALEYNKIEEWSRGREAEAWPASAVRAELKAALDAVGFAAVRYARAAENQARQAVTELPLPGPAIGDGVH